MEDDIESEDEVAAPAQTMDDENALKRTRTDDTEEHQPAKKLKTGSSRDKNASKKRKGGKNAAEIEAMDVVLPEELSFDVPDVAVVRITPGFTSSLSPSRSLSPVPETYSTRLTTPPPTPPPTISELEICEDDEDLYFAKLVLSNHDATALESLPSSTPDSATDSISIRKHITGSARSEGFYAISHAEKAAYVTQYQARSSNTTAQEPADEPQPQQHVISSRSNRANARRRAQGLEEINQVQRAVALSKGETAANELSFKFNQLQTRKKHLRFARSPIHDWGLYALERIARGEMVIEYVGEIIRAQVADKREKTYERQGIGSSYLFRIDEDLVVDATKKGNLG